MKLGHVALDGTKIKANASKHKAMSYERMEKRAAELEAEVERWLSAAEAADAEEDRAFGRDKSGEELPKWVADKKKRAEKIRAAKAELEAEAKAAAAAKAKAQAEAEERRQAEGCKKPISARTSGSFASLVPVSARKRLIPKLSKRDSDGEIPESACV